jgi:hypothetical protein
MTYKLFSQLVRRRTKLFAALSAIRALVTSEFADTPLKRDFAAERVVVPVHRPRYARRIDQVHGDWRQ